MKDLTLVSSYSSSRALIIGIDRFKKAPPLNHAVNDATAILNLLVSDFAFRAENITFLKNEQATRKKIMSCYLALSGNGSSNDDRILIFFAGHGFTCRGTRGDVGFLLPYDGNTIDLSSLIRWDDLTNNTELINAKHILFIMDACYSGLAISRSFSAGSVRFLKDMLMRPVRQVITAGKADEVVADSGGPKPGHSVFTGHLLMALEGQAKSEDGILTANGVMSYVYEKVSKDIHSRQTPHFGSFDGDGDFIFSAPIIDSLNDKEIDKDVLFTVPSADVHGDSGQTQTFQDQIKTYLSDQKYFIKLDDLAVKCIRQFLVSTVIEKFPLQSPPFTDSEFNLRLSNYELAILKLKILAICIAYWGQTQHLAILQKIASRITDNLVPENGYRAWSALRWHPLSVLSYSAGISALSAQRFDSLHALFFASAQTAKIPEERAELIYSLGNGIHEMEQIELFKKIKGFERYFTPRSEYMFKYIQPDLDDLIFLGKAFESLYDEYELFMALIHADSRIKKGESLWGPIGRFGWKFKRRSGPDNPLHKMIEIAKREGASWGPLKVGFFDGNLDKFIHLATEFSVKLNQLHW